MRLFYKTATEYLVTKMPLNNQFLRKVRFLQPQRIAQPWLPDAIKLAARKTPVDVEMDKLADEVRLYQLERIPESWYLKEGKTKEGDKVIPRSVDHYWREVFKLKNTMGEKKYTLLEKVVKATIVLSHRNSDVGRSFSESDHTVTSERNRLSETSINSIRATEDGMKLFDNKPYRVPITTDLKSEARSAHANYVLRLEAEKKAQAQAKKDEENCEAEKKRVGKQTKRNI